MPRSDTRKVEIVTVKKPKARPRGDPSAVIPHQFNSETARAAQAKRKTFKGGAAKLSIAYAMTLTNELPNDIRVKLGVDGSDYDGITWADVISLQTHKRAVGLVDDKGINFTAITEIRETTEGRIADKSEFSGAGGAPLQAPPIQVQFVKPTKE